MNIKDSYLHGGTHVVKNINFSIAASGTNQNKLVATITWAEEGSSNTELAIPISGATFGSLTKNTVFAAPNGSNGVPSFRTLIAADIPNISANKITSDTLGADRLPLATNSARGAVILGVAKTSDADSAITGKKYWVKMNANGKLFIDVPWNDNTHYTAVPILGGTDATSNATSDTANNATYLNIIENSAKSGGIKITGSGATTVKANGGILTINSTNTWKAANSSQEGYVPKLVSGGTALSNSTNDYILAFTYANGTLTPSWKKLPANAYLNNTYTVNNATYSIKSKIGDTTTTLSDFTANQSSADDFTLIQGSNITFTNDTTNRTLTIAGTPNTTYKLTLNGTVKGTTGGTDLGTFYAIATSDTSTANQVWMRNSSNDGYGWRTLGSRAFDSTDYIPKITYEYNKEISFSSSGKLLIGKFPCYDSNVTIYLDATSSTTYHATIILATQNIDNSHGGTINFNVYGDETNSVAPRLYLYYPSNSRYIEIYFSPLAFSKTIIHIKCCRLLSAPTNICENVESIPDAATTKPSNMLTANFLKLSGGTVTGDITATTFIGNLTGIASTATNMAYTGLTGSSTTANQAIVSNGTANGWTLKTLGNRAFDSTSYLPLSGGTMTGSVYFSAALSAYSSEGIRFKNNDNESARIGGDAFNGLGLYAVGKIFIRPNVTLGSQSNNGLIISSTEFTYNGNKVYHSGNIPSNSKDAAGIVSKGVASRVYMTDSTGAPSWTLYDTTVTLNSGKLVTSGAVYTAIANNVASAVQYLGTVTSSSDMIALTSAGKGDFARVTSSFTFTDATGSSVTAHVGDVVYLTNDTPGTASNWIVAHTEIDTNTWTAASTSAAGYVPKLATGGANLAAASTDYVLAYINGATTPSWKKLPANAYKNDNTTGIKLATVSGTKKTDSTLISIGSGTGLSIAGGTNKFSIGNGTNYIEVSVAHGLSTKNISINGTNYALYTSASSLPTIKAPTEFGTANLILATNADATGLTWVNKPATNVTTSLYVGASNGTATAAQTAGNVHLILKEGSSYTRYKITGSGRASVTSDANGTITINSAGYSNFVKSGSTAAAGLVPSPGTTAGTGKFLCEDGTWSIPAYPTNADTVDGYHANKFFKLYTRTDIGISPNFNNPKIGNECVNGYFELRTSRETTGESGSKPFDSFGSFINITYSNTIFLLAGNNSNGWKIRGRLVANIETLGTGDDLSWQTILTSANYSSYVKTMVKSGSNHAGGLVPDPGETEGTTKFLREDGTWSVPSYTTDTVRPIYSGGTSRFTSSLKTAINFVGAGATSVTFLAAGTEDGQSGSASYASIKISSNNDLVKFSAITANTEYYLSVRAKNTTDTAQLLYRTSIIVKDSTITATLSGNASTATNLSKTSGTNRGYLYLSANTTTACTGVGSVAAAADIGIPYIGYASNANTYGIYKDLFYLSGTIKYIGNNVHSNKFACIKTKDSVTDDWTGSSTSGSQSGSGTTYTAGDGISINNGTISTTRKEWYGTEAQFNSLSSLDNNTTYYIMAT